MKASKLRALAVVTLLIITESPQNKIVIILYRKGILAVLAVFLNFFLLGNK
jgi:hypothetical protein